MGQDWLDEEEEAEEAAEPEAADDDEPEADAKGADKDDDEGEEATAEEGGTADATADKTVPLAALQSVRREKKAERAAKEAALKENEELKRRLDALDRDVQAFKRAPPEPKKKEEFDPEGLFENPKEVFGRFKSAIERDRAEERMLESDEEARLMFDDYDEAMAKLEEWAKATPGAQEGLRASRKPALYAYRGIKKWEKSLADKAEHPDVKTLREEAEALRKENEELRKRTGKPPRSVSNARGSRPSSLRVDDDDSVVFRKY